jgi:hypothetical protein
MESFDIEVDAPSNNRGELPEIASALAESAADLLDGTAGAAATEYGSAVLNPEANGPQAESGSDCIPQGDADGGSQHSGEDAGASTESGGPVTTETEAAARAALQAQRSARGTSAHYLGETVGAYVGRIVGARRVKSWSNHHSLDGMQFQIRTISGRQNTFTVNFTTEPEKIIVAAKRRDATLDGSSRYALFGVLRADAFAVAKKSMSRGHLKSGHHLVSLAQVHKVGLGSVVIPDDLVVADTSERRLQLLDGINLLEPDLDNPAVQAARAFLAAVPALPEEEGSDD